jgi:hypothetical protein
LGSDANPSQEFGGKYYMELIDEMRQQDKTTLYVNFQHLIQFDQELAEVIEIEYYR